MRFAAAVSLFVTLGTCAARGAEPYPYSVKREPACEFARKPAVMRAGDRVTISFASKAYCDAAVAIEDADGRIIRYLACGVLGDNAPAPFQKNSLEQTLLWDGKDEAGAYVDDKDNCSVRVSLGLRPRFERSLFWDPKKRLGAGTILLAADAEGVYVYDVNGSEMIRLYNHDGNYARTVYPFPADRIEQVAGLPWRAFPDGARAPAKRAYFLATLLQGRESGGVESTIRINSEATGMALRDGRIALAGQRLNRLATDGSSGGLPVWGPRVDVQPEAETILKFPRGLALSPDGKQLYLTGYAWLHPRGWAPVGDARWTHALYRMDYAANDPPKVFIGEENRRGRDDAHFDHPAAVAVDNGGRIYVADHLNDRVQVFSPEGKLLKSLAVQGPAQLAFHHKTQELYVFSWYLSLNYYDRDLPAKRVVAPRMRWFAPYPALELRGELELPLQGYRCEPVWSFITGSQYQAALDSWTDPPALWLITDRGGYPIRFRIEKDRLVKVQDFLEDARRSGIRLKPVTLNRQRLYVDPLRGDLYVAEGDVATQKGFSNLLRIDPATGRCRQIEIPFTAEDLAIGPDGLFHLRTGTIIGRFNGQTWREVPFDYGEEHNACFIEGRSQPLIAGLMMPSVPVNPHWHLGGLDVNARGDIVVTCFNPNSRTIPTRQEEGREPVRDKGKPFTPQVYPGRRMSGHEMHVWDRYGKVRFEDVLQGVTEIVGGVQMDVRGNVYANVSVSLMLNGKPYWRLVGHRFDQVGTLVKFRPGEGKFTTGSHAGTPVPLADPPKRPPELDGVWVDGAEWFYPGVGRTQWGMDCSCWNSRFVLDYFARSFAPEYDRFSVAVLDTSGNLITRIGRYGNADDGVPLRTEKPGPDKAAGVKDTPRSEIRNPKSLGGDEVALFEGTFLAVHTDRRLFIADPGNARIVAVSLDYYATERVPLKGVPDGGK